VAKTKAMPNFFTSLGAGVPYSPDWKDLVSLAGAGAIYPHIEALVADLRDTIAKGDAICISDASFNSVYEAANIAIVMGYALARTWPTNGMDGLDHWVADALKMAKLEKPTEVGNRG
jgi:hypothetical protein